MQWNRPYTYAEYQDYIANDQRWERNRLFVFQRENYKCEWCNATNVPLHCHHSPEAYAFPLGSEPTNLLHCLCGDCHAWYHNKGGKRPNKLRGSFKDTPPECINPEAISLHEIDDLIRALDFKFGTGDK